MIQGVLGAHFWTHCSPELGLQGEIKISPSDQKLGPKIKNGPKWEDKILEGKILAPTAAQFGISQREEEVQFQMWKCSSQNVEKGSKNSPPWWLNDMWQKCNLTNVTLTSNVKLSGTFQRNREHLAFDWLSNSPGDRDKAWRRDCLWGSDWGS